MDRPVRLAPTSVALLFGIIVGLPGCAPPPERTAYMRLRAEADSLIASDRLETLAKRMHAAAVSDSLPEWLREWARVRAASADRMLGLGADARAQLAATARPLPSSVGEDPPGWQWLRPALQRQLDTRLRVLGADSPETAESMVALARVERYDGDASRAAELVRAALRIQREALGPESPEVAECYLGIARDLKLAAKRIGDPMPYCDSSLAIRSRRFGEESPEYVEALLLKANVARWSGHAEASLPLFDRALELAGRAGGSGSERSAEVLADKAATEMRRADWSEVERLSGRAVAILDHLGGAAVHTSEYSLALNLRGLSLRHLGRFGEARHELERAVAVQEERRAAAPMDGAVRARFYGLAAYSDLAAAALLQGDSLAAWVAQDRGNSRGCLERAWARGLMDSATCWDGLLKRVQTRLTDSSAVIGWLDPLYQPGTSGNPSWGYVIRSTGGVRWIAMLADSVKAPQAGFFDLARSVGQRMQVAASWPYRIESWGELERVRCDAWKLRFSRFEPMLTGVRELVVVSPNLNYFCPIELMLDDHGRELGDRFAISYSPSAVHFATGPDPGREARVKSKWTGLLLRAPDLAGFRPGSMLAAPTEIRHLADHLASPLIIAGDRATEERVRALVEQGVLARADLIHIAAHGNASSWAGSDTWLALAEATPGATPRAGATSPDRDGLLTMTEVEGWRVGARLVTLASCESGGREPGRAQGSVSVSQAFLDAGARSVVASLWAVHDDATARFMGHFYDALFERRPHPRSIAEAMREARLRLRNDRDASGARPYAHPLYWSGFVLLGDPG